jgi:probable F420-dependent oxidoreductase
VGVVLQTTPPERRVIDDSAKRSAESYGFGYVWTFDSHILWQEPYVIYSQILAETRNVIVGPMVTNPATRDWTVTASVYATLNEMYGNRTVCGIGRGDSAVRVTNGAPTTLATLRDSIHVIRELANGEPWSTRAASCGCRGRARAAAGDVGRGLRAEGAGAHRRGGRRLHPAARRPVDRRVDHRGGATPRRQAGRDPDDVTICVAAPAYVTDGTEAGLAHGREQCRWFGGMVGNHVADIVARYGDDAPVPARRSPTTSRTAGLRLQRARPGRQQPHHVRARRDRRPVLHRRPGRDHIQRMQDLKDLGVDQFAVYLQHDDKDHTLQAYGEKIMPAGPGAPQGARLTRRRRVGTHRK